ncbi:hypothetical protein CDD82_5016 [Ophiocordyceps australis]|uniref:Zn(2)-C6 fungal-type domain-containing protein n=1 Tax=Ophiocordyceps australis TaxID=1399860 RepID=A0A2C5Z3M0_9HYPO|nr:hypothetical protein CDD82_5016 [Ophiocordyceps australis]
MDEDHGDHGDHDRKRQPGVKRACNECRQQKLRCDVVQDPFQTCSRCNRLKLECKIESNFKRIGKRSKHAEMEREIERLRRKVARAKSHGFLSQDDEHADGSPLPMMASAPHANVSSTHDHVRHGSMMGSDEAVSSLLNLKTGGNFAMQPQYSHQLENVRLNDSQVAHLFNEFFYRYHPFLPFLNPQQPPEIYKQQHPLLFWSMIAVAARRFTRSSDCRNLLDQLSGPLTRYLWSTIGEVPSNYHVVKALCLLCTWPLPTSTTTSDPTHILCGVMMKTATGVGLHRPNHIRDFSRVSVDLDADQLRDRITTWAVCNIVAQSIGTGYGQPASTLYDWTLAMKSSDSDQRSSMHLSPELEARLQIERFCDKVSKEMYSNASDPRGVAGDEHRAILLRVFRRDYGELHASIMSQTWPNCVVSLHLRAAGLHMRLAGLFDSSKTPGYMDDLMGLWRAATSFLDEFLQVGRTTFPRDAISGNLLPYATNYLQQMLVAATFTLLKLMKSFLYNTIDFERGRSLFHHAIRAIRATSVVTNDLQWRLAELMVQMWNGARLEHRNRSIKSEEDTPIQIDDSLQLKVRCRHSMSLVFDSVWRWREEFQAQGRGSLENTKHPTNPDSANDSSAASSQMDSSLMAPDMPSAANNVVNMNGTLASANNAAIAPTASAPNSMIGASMAYSDANYELFDPQNWMLDGLIDFNYNMITPLEGA